MGEGTVLDLEVKDIRRVTYNPNDVIVVRCATRITPEVAQAMKDRLRDAFPTQKIVILDPSVELDFVAPEA